MNFDNIDKTEIFDAFLGKYRDKIDLNSTISVYNSDCQGGNIVQQLESTNNDSPYICDVENFEIMRSESICSACNFTASSFTLAIFCFPPRIILFLSVLGNALFKEISALAVDSDNARQILYLQASDSLAL